MRRTLFSLLLRDRDLLRWEVFCVHFAVVGRELSRETGNGRLATASVGRITFDRWASGAWCDRPRGEAAQILESMLKHSIEELFSLAPEMAAAEAALMPVVDAPRLGFGTGF
ncbi:hypothetical protein ABZ682_18745 [Streptomyces griseoviridis]|uniref:hypothetical protein n=1 Tax=Streptomyces griseoviridis TaxID=45398 RepID=UPI0033F77874